MTMKQKIVLLIGCVCALAGAHAVPTGHWEGHKKADPVMRRDTIWRDTLRRDTFWLTAPPRSVAQLGDVRLGRVRQWVVQLDAVPAGDTLSVIVTSAADPFKKVELFLEDSTLTQLDVPIFKHQSRAEKARKPVLTIQNKWGLKRGLAHIEAYATPPKRAMIRYTVREWEISGSPDGASQLDTIQRDWVIGPQGEKTLLAEKRIKRDDKGRIRRGEKLATTVRHPSKPITLSPGGVQTLPRRGARVFRYSEFKPGDTLLFSVAAIGEKPMHLVSLSDDQRVYKREARESARFSDKVVVGREAYWTLRLESNLGLQKQRAEITVTRIPPARIESVVQDSGDTVLQVETKILYDTLALLIKDDSLLLTPILDLSQKNVASVEIAIPQTLPKGFNLMFAAYWVGINSSSINTYRALEETVPSDWAKPGVPPALCAYALEKPLQLPFITLSDVGLVFNRGGAYPKDKSDAKPLWGVSAAQNMGIITAGELQKARLQKGVYYFYASFKNNNNVNTYPAQVKIIAFYRKKKGEETKTTLLRIDKN
jgi:hypothetical protein